MGVLGGLRPPNTPIFLPHPGGSHRASRRKNLITVEIKKDGQAVGILTAAEKIFKTGSLGFFGMGKIQIDDKRYQIQVQSVEIGSKPKAEEEK